MALLKDKTEYKNAPMIISLPLAGTPTEARCGHQQQQEKFKATIKDSTEKYAYGVEPELKEKLRRDFKADI